MSFSNDLFFCKLIEKNKFAISGELFSLSNHLDKLALLKFS
jgi:hypothetical protein